MLMTLMSIYMKLESLKRFAKCCIDYWIALYIRKSRFAPACLFSLIAHTVDFLTGLIRGHVWKSAEIFHMHTWTVHIINYSIDTVFIVYENISTRSTSTTTATTTIYYYCCCHYCYYFISNAQIVLTNNVHITCPISHATFNLRVHFWVNQQISCLTVSIMPEDCNLSSVMLVTQVPQYLPVAHVICWNIIQC